MTREAERAVRGGLIVPKSVRIQTSVVRPNVELRSTNRPRHEGWYDVSYQCLGARVSVRVLAPANRRTSSSSSDSAASSSESSSSKEMAFPLRNASMSSSPLCLAPSSSRSALGAAHC